ncbi:Penicillin G acylase [Bienertia sinuspersici]
MNSLSFASSLLRPSTCKQPPLFHRLRVHSNCLHWYSHNRCHDPRYSAGFSSIRFHLLNNHRTLVRSTSPPEEGVVAVMNFEELVEKDWSFLESDNLSSKEHEKKIDQIISAANIAENSKVLVSIGSEEFVDRLLDSSPCQLLLYVHESILSLACIKERHDKVKCWQGELIFVPEKWAPLDVVFLYFLPALPFKLDDIFKTLANRCSPGASVVISHLQGRQALEQQRQQYPDIVVSDLPEKMKLEKVASEHSFRLKDFVDDSSLYLAVLEFKE